MMYVNPCTRGVVHPRSPPHTPPHTQTDGKRAAADAEGAPRMEKSHQVSPRIEETHQGLKSLTPGPSLDANKNVQCPPGEGEPMTLCNALMHQGLPLPPRDPPFPVSLQVHSFESRRFFCPPQWGGDWDVLFMSRITDT